MLNTEGSRYVFANKVPSHIQRVIKNMLKPKGDPFDPSQYDWKPTLEDLKNLERIILEGDN